MPGINRTDHLLQMELISLDEHLCRVLDRTKNLCEQAEQYDGEADRIQEVNTILLFTKHLLDRLSRSAAPAKISDSIDPALRGHKPMSTKHIRTTTPTGATIPNSGPVESNRDFPGY